MRCRFVMLAFLAAVLATPCQTAEPDLARIKDWVSAGRWQEAGAAIGRQLEQEGLDFRAREALLFERERMRRIRLDFRKTPAQVYRETSEIFPGLTQAQFDRWDSAGAVESLVIDGQRWCFNRSAGNLFRVHPEARREKAKRKAAASRTPQHRLEALQQIIRGFAETGQAFNSPQRFRVAYTLSVKPDAVPAGETIRAWLPSPQNSGRQKQVRLVSADPTLFVHGGRAMPLACVYLEKPATAGQPTVFKIEFEYTASGFHQPIEVSQVRPVATNQAGLAPFLLERPPHIVFTDEVRALSRAIVGSEENPYLKARRIFQWIDENIPWAGAREYSTLDSLALYALARRQGDCGIQTMLFITLCRLNGIPAHWESGWTTGPDKNMHDWCLIYLAPYGWLPVDVSYGLVDSQDERERWFYLGGIDAFRLVVNRDYSQPLYPAKIYFRSETVDFQRGEVEWRGGNLYFDQWTWNLDVQEISLDLSPAGNKKMESR